MVHMCNLQDTFLIRKGVQNGPLLVLNGVVSPPKNGFAWGNFTPLHQVIYIYNPTFWAYLCGFHLVYWGERFIEAWSQHFELFNFGCDRIRQKTAFSRSLGWTHMTQSVISVQIVAFLWQWNPKIAWIQEANWWLLDDKGHGWFWRFFAWPNVCSPFGREHGFFSYFPVRVLVKIVSILLKQCTFRAGKNDAPMDFLHVRCSNIIGESMHTKTLKLGSFNEKPASTIFKMLPLRKLPLKCAGRIFSHHANASVERIISLQLFSGPFAQSSFSTIKVWHGYYTPQLGGGNSNIFMFTPIWGNDLIWWAYFSKGLVQPPPRTTIGLPFFVTCQFFW